MQFKLPGDGETECSDSFAYSFCTLLSTEDSSIKFVNGFTAIFQIMKQFMFYFRFMYVYFPRINQCFDYDML